MGFLVRCREDTTQEVQERRGFKAGEVYKAYESVIDQGNALIGNASMFFLMFNPKGDVWTYEDPGIFREYIKNDKRPIPEQPGEGGNEGPKTTPGPGS